MAIFGTSEAAKSQKGGQTWQKKMMQSAHQWEQQDLQLAGLNPILSAVGGSPGSYSSSAPIGPSSAQEVASLAQAGSNVIEGVGKGIQYKKLKEKLNYDTERAKFEKGIASWDEMGGQHLLDARRADAQTKAYNADIAGEQANQSRQHTAQSVMDTIIRADQMNLLKDTIPQSQRKRKVYESDEGELLTYLREAMGAVAPVGGIMQGAGSLSRRGTQINKSYNWKR